MKKILEHTVAKFKNDPENIELIKAIQKLSKDRSKLGMLQFNKKKEISKKIKDLAKKLRDKS